MGQRPSTLQQFQGGGISMACFQPCVDSFGRISRAVVSTGRKPCMFHSMLHPPTKPFCGKQRTASRALKERLKSETIPAQSSKTREALGPKQLSQMQSKLHAGSPHPHHRDPQR